MDRNCVSFIARLYEQGADEDRDEFFILALLAGTVRSYSCSSMQFKHWALAGP